MLPEADQKLIRVERGGGVMSVLLELVNARLASRRGSRINVTLCP